jgi:hypothetical protein
MNSRPKKSIKTMIVHHRGTGTVQQDPFPVILIMIVGRVVVARIKEDSRETTSAP